jgi:hypothetical protein
MASPTITFRLSPKENEFVRAYVATVRQRGGPRYSEYNLTSFVMDAVKEKLAHVQRSKKARAKRRTPPVDGSQELIDVARSSARKQPTVDDAAWGVGT